MLAVAIPMSEPAGHDAGFALNVASGAGLLDRRQPRGELLGEDHRDAADVRLRPAWEVPFTVRLAPFCLLVFACVLTLNTGWNGRSAQFAACKRAGHARRSRPGCS